MAERVGGRPGGGESGGARLLGTPVRGHLRQGGAGGVHARARRERDRGRAPGGARRAKRRAALRHPGPPPVLVHGRPHRSDGRRVARMSRARYYCAASLDGYIAQSDDNLDWLTGYRGSYGGDDAQPMKGSYDRFYDEVGALVMGSVTYEWALRELDAWPYMDKPSWVLSSRDLTRPEGAD